MNIPASEVYFETQKALYCGKHALNNLLQAHVFSKAKLDELCVRLQHSYARMLGKRHGIIRCSRDGNYESAVLLAAIRGIGLGVEEANAFSSITHFLAEKASNKLIGFLFNLGDKHWTSMNCNKFSGFNLYLDSQKSPTKTYLALNDTTVLQSIQQLMTKTPRFSAFAVFAKNLHPVNIFDEIAAAGGDAAFDRKLKSPVLSSSSLSSKKKRVRPSKSMTDAALLAYFATPRKKAGKELNDALFSLTDKELSKYLFSSE